MNALNKRYLIDIQDVLLYMLTVRGCVINLLVSLF